MGGQEIGESGELAGGESEADGDGQCEQEKRARTVSLHDSGILGDIAAPCERNTHVLLTIWDCFAILPGSVKP